MLPPGFTQMLLLGFSQMLPLCRRAQWAPPSIGVLLCLPVSNTLIFLDQCWSFGNDGVGPGYITLALSVTGAAFLLVACSPIGMILSVTPSHPPDRLASSPPAQKRRVRRGAYFELTTNTAAGQFRPSIQMST